MDRGFQWGGGSGCDGGSDANDNNDDNDKHDDAVMSVITDASN